MSVLVQTKFVLTGPLASRSIVLGSQPYPFRDGELTLTATPEEMALHARFLQRNWQAYPEGHPKLESEVVDNGKRDIQTNSEPNPKSQIPGDMESKGSGVELRVSTDNEQGTVDSASGTTRSISNGDGQPEELNEKLLRAVKSLDPLEDSHWTREGKPAMTAVEKSYGSADVTRSDVESVAPGFIRPKLTGETKDAQQE